MLFANSEREIGDERSVLVRRVIERHTIELLLTQNVDATTEIRLRPALQSMMEGLLQGRLAAFLVPTPPFPQVPCVLPSQRLLQPLLHWRRLAHAVPRE